MTVERSNNEIIIRIPASTDLTGLQRLLDYIKFREIASKSKAKAAQIDKLATQSKKEWWTENKEDFLK